MATEKIIRNALIGEGIMHENWRFTINRVYAESFTTAWINVTVYEPRCKKPATEWEIPMDMTRNMVDMTGAELVYNKYVAQ